MHTLKHLNLDRTGIYVSYMLALIEFGRGVAGFSELCPAQKVLRYPERKASSRPMKRVLINVII